jgi:hypothetical protein
MTTGPGTFKNRQLKAKLSVESKKTLIFYAHKKFFT